MRLLHSSCSPMCSPSRRFVSRRRRCSCRTRCISPTPLPGSYHYRTVNAQRYLTAQFCPVHLGSKAQARRLGDGSKSNASRDTLYGTHTRERAARDRTGCRKLGNRKVFASALSREIRSTVRGSLKESRIAAAVDASRDLSRSEGGDRQRRAIPIKRNTQGEKGPICNG